MLLMFPSVSFRVEIFLGFNLFLCPFFAMKLLWGLRTRDCVGVNLQCSWSLTHACNSLILQPITSSSSKAIFMSKLNFMDTSSVSKCDSTLLRLHVGLVGGSCGFLSFMDFKRDPIQLTLMSIPKYRKSGCVRAVLYCDIVEAFLFLSV